jgi:hypothetical protein
MAAWDVGMGLVGAAACNVDTTYWVAGTKAEINELYGGDNKNDELGWYDVIGLAGAVYGLAVAGVDFDPTSGEHAAASSTAELAAILATYQINNGGFAWNKWWVIPNDFDEDHQATAYAMLALNAVNRPLYLSKIKGAADYLLSVQNPSGGWYGDEYHDVENNEVTGEVLWGIATAYPMPEVWVCETGNCGHPGFQFATIQGGINAVDPGGIVHVLPGTYAEAITLNKPDITVKSTAGAESTIIDVPFGSLTVGVKVLANMGTVTFDGFKVQNFTEAGIIQGMSARTGTAFNVLNNILLPYNGYLRNGIQVSVDGSTVIGNTITSAYLTSSWSSTAIGVVDASNVLVQNNTITGVGDYGISAYTWNVSIMSNIEILGNTITGIDYPLGVIAYNDGTVSNVDLHLNKLSGYVGAIEAKAYDEPGYESYWGTLVSDVDATHNWWGSPTGPQAPVLGDPQINQWCADSDCDTFAPDVNGVIELSGNINVPGDIEINVPHLTIHLASDTVIQNDSPCFIINADNTRIIAEPGAKCIPTDAANGIDVAAGITGVTVEGLEITKGATATGDGIAFAGAVTDIVLVDNWIHGLDGDGISFAAAPARLVDIHGNLFQDNVGNGIEAGEFTVPAEYNSWGSYDGPTSGGDGISTAVDADPYTHVDLYLVPSGTPWANQVVNGDTITYEIKALMKNINAADFVLKYDPVLLSVASVTPGADFVGLPLDDDPETSASLVDSSVDGELHFRGAKLGGTVSGDVTLFTVTFNAEAAGTSALNFDEATDMFGMPGAGSSSNVYVAGFDTKTVKVIDLPVISSPDMRGYFLTGEQREYSVSVDNPLTGGAYSHVRFQFKIIGAELSDITSLQYFEVMDSTWKNLPLTPDGLGNLVGYFGPSVGMPMPAGYSGTSQFRLTAAVAGEYPTEITLVDFDSVPANFVLSTLTETTIVFNKPVITTTGLTGNHQGLSVPFTLNIDNMSTMVDPYLPTAVTFLVDLDLPDGTVLTTPDGSVTCDATGCQFPVTLAAGTNAISLTAAFTGTMTVTSVPVTLFDDLADPDRELATASFGPVAVFDNVPAVLGTVSMQGRTTRAGVPVTLTAVTVPYGPYLATSIEQISNNLSFANVAEGSYTITTNQPRYLNITSDLAKVVAISDAKTSLSSLELKGGNANWTDSIIDIFDAVAVGTTYGNFGNVDGDVNFDGKVNIQDLALVGGNYRLTSADVYGSWVP